MSIIPLLTEIYQKTKALVAEGDVKKLNEHLKGYVSEDTDIQVLKILMVSARAPYHASTTKELLANIQNIFAAKSNKLKYK